MIKKKLLPISPIYYTGPITDHFDGERFFNPWNHKIPKASDLFRWKMRAKPIYWSKKIKEQHKDIPPSIINGNDLRITFVGHSTILIQTQGLNILTDPIWSTRASPFQWIGPKRFHHPGILWEDLPKIDIVLISHNHYDHLDLNTLEKIWSRYRPLIIAPLGNDRVIQIKHPQIEVKTLDWHESILVSKNVNINLEPVQHWSARGILDKNKALWGAFVIESLGGNIYFSGDTGYGDGSFFKKTFNRYKKIRFAMLPIGAYKPLWFMNYAHMSPEDAALAYRDLGEPYTAAIHFQTFRLGDEGYEEPKISLLDALRKLHLNTDKFRPLQIGESWMIPCEEIE